MGEGIVRKLRPLIGGKKDGWLLSAHKRFLWQQALERMESSVQTVAGKDSDKRVQERKQYVKYDSLSDVQGRMLRKMPISGLVCEKEVAGCLVRSSKEDTVWLLVPTQLPCHVSSSGCEFFQYKLSEVECIGMNNDSSLLPCVLLPQQTSTGEGEQCPYYMLTSEWQAMISDASVGHKLVTPRYAGNINEDIHSFLLQCHDQYHTTMPQ